MVAFTLKAQKRTHGYSEFDLADRLRQFGWVVPVRLPMLFLEYAFRTLGFELHFSWYGNLVLRCSGILAHSVQELLQAPGTSIHLFSIILVTSCSSWCTVCIQVNRL